MIKNRILEKDGYITPGMSVLSLASEQVLCTSGLSSVTGLSTGASWLEEEEEAAW